MSNVITFQVSSQHANFTQCKNGIVTNHATFITFHALVNIWIVVSKGELWTNKKFQERNKKLLGLFFDEKTNPKAKTNREEPETEQKNPEEEKEKSEPSGGAAEKAQ